MRFAPAFISVCAWLRRAENAWHLGINDYADVVKKTSGEEWPHWLYTTKSAFEELNRGPILFAGERAQEKPLRCALGKRCRECPILQAVQVGMERAAARKVFPAKITPADIDAAKVATCVGHILTSGENPTDGAFWWREGDEP